MGGVADTPGAARCSHLRPAHRHLPAARVRRHAGPQPGLPGRLPDRHGGVRPRPHGGRRLPPRMATVLSVVVPDHQPGHRRQHGRADRRARSGAERSSSGWRCSSRRLLERQTQLRFELAESERERTELESLRAALTAPELPAVDGLQIATSYTPADGLVAGDFFLVTRGAENSTLVVVGDVVGHGLAAARRASFVRATIALFAEYADDPMTILRLANTALAERDPGHRVRHRAVRELRPRPRHRHVGERRPPAAVGPRPRRAAGQRAPLPAAGDRADARGHLGDDRAGARRGRPALHRRPARGPHRARGRSPRPLRRAGRARDAGRACRARRRPTSSPGLRAAAVRHAEGRPADDLCMVAIRLGAGEAGSAAGRVGAEAPVARDRARSPGRARWSTGWRRRRSRSA